MNTGHGEALRRLPVPRPGAAVGATGGHHREGERGPSSPGQRNVTPCVVGLHRSAEHRFSKEPVDAFELVAGVGVVGDAHAGPLVQHRSRSRPIRGSPTSASST